MSYSKIIHTKSEAVGAIPAESSLSYGEIAINYSDGNLYIKKADNTIRMVASSEFSTDISRLLTDVSSLTQSVGFTSLQFISAENLIFGRGNKNEVSSQKSLTYGLTNTIGSDAEFSATFGISNSAAASRSILIGSNNTGQGTDSIAVGDYIIVPQNVAEFGKWSSSGNRESSIRCADRNIAMTLQDSSTSIADGGSLSGEETDNTLPYNMYSIRRSGDEVLLDVNIDGTVKTCSIGTSSREQLGDNFTSKGIPIQNNRNDADSSVGAGLVTSIRHLTQNQYTALVAAVEVDSTTLYIVD